MSVFEPLIAASSLPVISVCLIALFSLSIAVMESVVAFSAFAVSGLIGGAILFDERISDCLLQCFDALCYSGSPVRTGNAITLRVLYEISKRFLHSKMRRIFLFPALLLSAISFFNCGCRNETATPPKSGGNVPVLLFNGRGTSPGDV